MSKPTTSKGAIARTVYSARRRDGTYRWVEAVSWKDAKRYFGSDAVSIRKRVISVEDYHDSMFDQASQRDIYELGYVRPENHGPLRRVHAPPPVESAYAARLHRAAPALLDIAKTFAMQLADALRLCPCTLDDNGSSCVHCLMKDDFDRIMAIVAEAEGGPR